MFGVWPSGEIGSALTDEFQRQRRTQAMNLRQVDAEDRMQCGLAHQRKAGALAVLSR